MNNEYSPEQSPSDEDMDFTPIKYAPLAEHALDILQRALPFGPVSYNIKMGYVYDNDGKLEVESVLNARDNPMENLNSIALQYTVRLSRHLIDEETAFGIDRIENLVEQAVYQETSELKSRLVAAENELEEKVQEIEKIQIMLNERESNHSSI